MATMLNGAAVMDAALLLIGGSEATLHIHVRTCSTAPSICNIEPTFTLSLFLSLSLTHTHTHTNT